jgi:hypothetical protein
VLFPTVRAGASGRQAAGVRPGIRRCSGAVDGRRTTPRIVDRRPTADVVRPQSDRISHSDEYAEIADCHQGARALAAVMKTVADRLVGCEHAWLGGDTVADRQRR